MNLPTEKFEDSCPRSEISAYIDGELAPNDELILESHIAVCAICATELNEQKKLLCALKSALEEEKEFQLPHNFTKIIVANAESKVSGLRRRDERYRAVFICIALFILVILGLGSDAEKVFGSFSQVGDQFLAVGNFAAHLVHDVIIGAIVILRSLCFQFVLKSAFMAAFLILFFIFSIFALSRLLIRYNRP